MSHKDNNEGKNIFNSDVVKQKHKHLSKYMGELADCGDIDVLSERRICPYLIWATKCNATNPCIYKNGGVKK